MTAFASLKRPLLRYMLVGRRAIGAGVAVHATGMRFHIGVLGKISHPFRWGMRERIDQQLRVNCRSQAPAARMDPRVAADIWRARTNRRKGSLSHVAMLDSPPIIQC